MGKFHKDLTGDDLHVPGYVTDTDPAPVDQGTGTMWFDTSTSEVTPKVRNKADDGWVTLLRQGDGASAAGSDTQVQYNNGGSFGGTTNLTWDDGSNVLTFGNGPVFDLATDQSYTWSGTTEALLVSGDASGSNAFLDIRSADSDGTDFAGFRVYALNDRSATDFEGLEFVFDTGGFYKLNAFNGGSGSLRDIKFQIGGTTGLNVRSSDQHVEVPQSLHVGGTGAASDTLDVDGTSAFSGIVTLQQPTQDYQIEGHNQGLWLQGQATGEHAFLDIASFDNDGTQFAGLRIFAVGDKNQTDWADVEFVFDSGNDEYKFATAAAGAESARDIKWTTGGVTGLRFRASDSHMEVPQALHVGGTGAASDTLDVDGGADFSGGVVDVTRTPGAGTADFLRLEDGDSSDRLEFHLDGSGRFVVNVFDSSASATRDVLRVDPASDQLAVPAELVATTTSRFDDTMSLNMAATQGYDLQGVSTKDGLFLRGDTAGEQANFWVVPNDLDATARAAFKLVTEEGGSLGDFTDASWFEARHNPVGGRMEIVTKNSGTGTLLPIALSGAGNAAGDLVLNTSGNLEIADGSNVVLGTTNGTQIGTGASQLLGFFGVTPVAQQTAPASLTNNMTATTTDDALEGIGDTSAGDESAPIERNFSEVKDELDQIRTLLINLGLAA